MIFSDRCIRKQLRANWLVIGPLGPNAVQPASVGVRLADEILVFRNNSRTHIDVREPAPDVTEKVRTEEGRRPFVLHLGQFPLGSTLEDVTVPDDIMARVEGKSSLACYGLLIHSTVGFVDPGWSGKVTLEFSNVGILGITLDECLQPRCWSSVLALSASSAQEKTGTPVAWDSCLFRRPGSSIGIRAPLSLSPNPPKDTDGRREDSGRWVRELPGR